MELSDDEKTALIRELDMIIEDDRFPLSPRIQTLRAILNQIRPEPVRDPLPPIKQYDPARHGHYRRRDR